MKKSPFGKPKPFPTKPRGRLRPVSPKRAILNREYEKAKRQWRAGHDGQCEMRFANNPIVASFHFPRGTPTPDAIRCTRRAMAQPHHSKGRGPFLSDASTFIGLCHECHHWTDTHRKQAVVLGYFTYVNPNQSK